MTHDPTLLGEHAPSSHREASAAVAVPPPRAGTGPAFPATVEIVGREPELAMFRQALESVGRHKTAVFLLSGEPGIGKSRLASEVGVVAEAMGFHVRWGRCWEAGGAPAYWPWIEVVRSCLRADPATLPEQPTAQAHHLALLLPELRERFPALPEVEPTADPDRARFQLFDGMASFLRAVAERQALVIVLDDLHAADHSSLVMLQFLARQLRDAPIMLVGCYRDTDVRPGSEIAPVLAEIARDGHHLALQGLREDAVGRFIDSVCPSAASPAVVSTMRTVTDGNPFFLGQIVGQLAAGRDLTGPVVLPDGVREAVRLRLRRLSNASIELLTLASVFGQEFSLHALASAAERPLDETGEALEEALGTRVIAERPGTLGHYVFFHGLIREVLYDGLPAGKRAELHGRVGSALERLYGADGDAHLGTLAHHFFMASSHGDAEKGIALCTRAADRALGVFAAPEAVEHYGRALQLLSLAGGDTSRTRCALLVGRGRALERAGDFEPAREDFVKAAAIARESGDTTALANAALGCGEQWALKFTCSIIDKSDLSLLEEALRVLPEEHAALRARLLGRAGSALFFAGAYDRVDQMSVAAIRLARRLGDSETLARALSARHAVLLGPDGLTERFAVADEILRLGETTGNREVLLRSHVLRLYDFVERGDTDDAESEIAHVTLLANEIGDPFEQWHCAVIRAAVALFRGRIDESECLARGAFDDAHRVPGQQREDQNATQCLLLQLAPVRREQGRARDVAAQLTARADQFPQVMGWQAMAALVDLDSNRPRAAADRLRHATPRVLAAAPRDSAWLGSMALFAEAFVRTRHRSQCERLFQILAPYADLHAIVASPLWLGSVTRALGQLAAALHRWDAAAALFERALAWHTQRGAPLWLAHTQVDFASMLIERGASGDRPQAHVLVDAAAAAAETLDAVRLGERVQALQDHAIAPGAATRTRASPAVAHGTAATPNALFRREGEYWTIAHGEHTIRLKHSRGLAMLAWLLAQPGRETHSADLVLAANPPPPAMVAPVTADDERRGAVSRRRDVAAPAIDLQARLAYRERLRALHGDLDEAGANNDVLRAGHLRSEIEQLTDELKRALGIGPGRRSGTDAERARLNATRAIHSAIVRIEETHPFLGEHLRRAIRTGMFCVYERDPASTIVWET